jgi:hypothetical protein
VSFPSDSAFGREAVANNAQSRISKKWGLTYAVRRDRQRSAGLARCNMYLDASRARCFAVGPRLDRGVRRRSPVPVWERHNAQEPAEYRPMRRGRAESSLCAGKTTPDCAELVQMCDEMQPSPDCRRRHVRLRGTLASVQTLTRPLTRIVGKSGRRRFSSCSPIDAGTESGSYLRTTPHRLDTSTRRSSSYLSSAGRTCNGRQTYEVARHELQSEPSRSGSLSAKRTHCYSRNVQGGATALRRLLDGGVTPHERTKTGR